MTHYGVTAQGHPTTCYCSGSGRRARSNGDTFRCTAYDAPGAAPAGGPAGELERIARKLEDVLPLYTDRFRPYVQTLTYEECKSAVAALRAAALGAAAPQTAEPKARAAALAQRFHETYERLAPIYGYETRRESAKPWAEVPEQNRRLMVAVCAELLAAAPVPAGEPQATLGRLREAVAALDYNRAGFVYLDAVLSLIDAEQMRAADGPAGEREPGAPKVERAALIEQLERAHKVVVDLSAGRTRWTMSVPVRSGVDPDLVIGGALQSALDYLAALPSRADAPAPEREAVITARDDVAWLRVVAQTMTGQRQADMFAALDRIDAALRARPGGRAEFPRGTVSTGAG